MDKVLMAIGFWLLASAQIVVVTRSMRAYSRRPSGPVRTDWRLHRLVRGDERYDISNPKWRDFMFVETGSSCPQDPRRTNVIYVPYTTMSTAESMGPDPRVLEAQRIWS